jgi:hypothetical protein
VLDFDNELLRSPAYSGMFLERMLLPRRDWQSEGVLLAHVHSIFLEIASKAFLYFHVLCVGSVPVGPFPTVWFAQWFRSPAHTFG